MKTMTTLQAKIVARVESLTELARSVDETATRLSYTDPEAAAVGFESRDRIVDRIEQGKRILRVRYGW